MLKYKFYLLQGRQFTNEQGEMGIACDNPMKVEEWTIGEAYAFLRGSISADSHLPSKPKFEKMVKKGHRTIIFRDKDENGNWTVETRSGKPPALISSFKTTETAQ